MFRFLFIALFVALAVAAPSFAQQPSTQPSTPQAAVISQPSSATEQLRRTVAFLRVGYADENRQLQQIAGTAFFVYYPDDRLGKDRGFSYLVTNRHMAAPGAEKGLRYQVQEMSLRVNRPDTRTSAEELIPLGPAVSWAYPDDEAIDLAVLPLGFDSKKVDILPINLSIFATTDKIQSERVTTGDQVVFAGYFYQFPGSKRIQPIVREGVLAMMPDEEIKTTLQKPGALYLADVHAFHGNSGSPLLVNIGGIRSGLVSGAGYLLLGVISGYYPEGESFSIPTATVLTGEVHDNSGITTVVPAYQLKALLDSQPLQAARDAEVGRQKKP